MRSIALARLLVAVIYVSLALCSASYILSCVRV